MRSAPYARTSCDESPKPAALPQSECTYEQRPAYPHAESSNEGPVQELSGGVAESSTFHARKLPVVAHSTAPPTAAVDTAAAIAPATAMS